MALYPREKAFLKALNAVRLTGEVPEPFEGNYESDITYNNFRKHLWHLWQAASGRMPVRPKYARSRPQPIRTVTFDVLNRYDRNADEPTKKATEALIGKLAWTLAVLLEQPDQFPRNAALAFAESHFDALSQHSVRLHFVPKWRALSRSESEPELRISSQGVDTQAWLYLFEFLREHPDVSEIVGRCEYQECRRFFERTRKGHIYCSNRCRSRDYQALTRRRKR